MLIPPYRTPGIVVLALGWALLLSSCKEVSFPQPQPADVAALKEVPKALQGEYRAADDNSPDADTLVIEGWGYHFRNGKGDDWLGRGVLSDSLVIKYFQNYYFINFRSGDQWVLRLVRQKPSGAIEFLSINITDDDKGRELLKKLSRKFKIKEIPKKDDNNFYQINPTKDQLMQLIKEGYFTGSELPKIK